MISLLLAFCFFGAPQEVSEKHAPALGDNVLRLRLEEGQELSYRSVTNMSMSVARGQGAEPIVVTTKQQQSLHYTVAAKTEKGYRIRTTVTDSKSAITQGQGAGTSLAKADKTAVGVTTEATYDDRGTAVGSLRVVQPGKAGSSGVSSNLSFFTSGFLGLIYPKGDVKKGSSWATSADMGKTLSRALGGMRLANKSGRVPIRFKVLKIEQSEKGRLAHIGISMQGKVEFAPMVTNGNIESGPLALVRSNGKAIVHLGSGLPIRCDLAAKTEIRTSDGNSIQSVTVAMKRQ